MSLISINALQKNLRQLSPRYVGGRDGTLSEATEQDRPKQAVATPYERIGGEAGLRQPVDAFYRTMATAPEAAGIRAMHKQDLGPIAQSVFEWLSGWLGGPPLYVQRRGTPCLTGPHRPFRIDQDARDQWMFCMRQALDELAIDREFRDLLEGAFDRMATMVRNQ